MKVSKRHLLVGITAWGTAITLLRGVRMPGDFAEAHWLVDYRFGFVKRGLLGAIFSTFSDLFQFPQTAMSIAVVSIAILALLSVMLLVATFRIVRTFDWNGDSLLFACVFVTSPFVVMIAYLNGFYDTVLVLLTLTTIVLIDRDHLWSAALVQATAVFIHESFVLIGFPCIVLASLLKTIEKENRRWSPKYFVPLFLPLLAFLILSMYQRWFVDQAHLRAMLIARLSSFEFIKRGHNLMVPKALTTGFGHYLRRYGPHLFQRLADREMLVSVVPTLFAILYFVMQRFKIRPVSVESFAVVCVVLAPLALHALAWDTERIWTYPIIGAFCVALVYARWGERVTPVKGPHFFWFGLPVLVLNIFGSTRLMLGEVERFTFQQRLLLYLPLLISSVAVVWPRSSHETR